MSLDAFGKNKKGKSYKIYIDASAAKFDLIPLTFVKQFCVIVFPQISMSLWWFFLLLSFAFSIAFLTPLPPKYLSYIKIYTNAGLFDFAYIVMYRSNWTLKGSVTCWKFSCKLSCSAVVHCQSLKWRKSAATHHAKYIVSKEFAIPHLTKSPSWCWVQSRGWLYAGIIILT